MKKSKSTNINYEKLKKWVRRLFDFINSWPQRMTAALTFSMLILFMLG